MLWYGLIRHGRDLISLNRSGPRNNSDSFLPLVKHLLVVCFLPAGLRVLNLVVLPLEPARLLFVSHLFFHEVLGTIFPVDAGGIPFSWTFNYGSHLGECRNLALSGVFLVVAMRIEDVTHFDELKVSFELGSDFGLG